MIDHWDPLVYACPSHLTQHTISGGQRFPRSLRPGNHRAGRGRDGRGQQGAGLSKEWLTPSTGLLFFCTYSSLTSLRKVGGAAASGTKIKRVDQIIEWLGGEAFDGLFMFDEAHRAKSYRVDKPEASSQMSQAVLQLQEACPRARVVYASATGLQSLESMAYASRLLLWGGNNASFPTFTEFAEEFLKKGDLSILELLAVELKTTNCYVARSLSWDVCAGAGPGHCERGHKYASCCLCIGLIG